MGSIGWVGALGGWVGSIRGACGGWGALGVHVGGGEH